MPIKIEDFDKPLNEELRLYLKEFSNAPEMFLAAQEKKVPKTTLHSLIYRKSKFKPHHASALTNLIGKVNKRLSRGGSECKRITELFSTYL